MAERIRRIWAKFWKLVDSNSVRHYIWVYYIPLFAFGVYATIWLPVNMVEPMLGHFWANAWAWVQIPATLCAMGGLLLRHGDVDTADMTPLRSRADWLGLCMQAGGHFCMCSVIAGGQVIMWSQFNNPSIWIWVAFAAFFGTSYVVGTALLSLQCVRKVLKGLELQRAVPV